MKVRDLLGAVRSNMIFAVEFRDGNMSPRRRANDSPELDKAFGDREIDNWFTIPGGICIDMTPEEKEEEEADDETELQVCPFCGGEPTATTTQSSTWGNDLWNVCCKCGVNTGWFASKEAAIEVWSRRTR